jgi:hypothetical protein
MAANLISQLSTANTFQHWLGATQLLVGTTNLLTNGNGESFFANTRLVIGGQAANVSLNVETGATINVVTSNTVNTTNVEVGEILVTGNLFAKTTISMNTGTGTFQSNEIVFQGPDDTLANANVTATVYTWDTTSNTLTLIKVTGDFVENANTYGATSTANWTTINTVAGFSFTSPNVAIPSNVEIERNLYVDGTARITGNTEIIGDLTVSGNLKLDAIGFDDLEVAGSGSFGNNLTVTGQTTLSNVLISGNVTSLNVSNSAEIGGSANIGGSVFIAGDLTIRGNVTLDSIGFDDLSVSGSATIANNLSVTGLSTFTGNATFANAEVTNVLTANILAGNANVAIYNTISQTEGSALAFAIALG